jgi:hypothetical protein
MRPRADARLRLSDETRRDEEGQETLDAIEIYEQGIRYPAPVQTATKLLGLESCLHVHVKE